MLIEKKAVMVPDPAVERLDEGVSRAAETPAAEFGKMARIRLTGDHRLEDAPPTGAQDVRDHRGQLDVRLLQHRLEALRMPHDLAAQLLARPRQIAQVLDRLRRDEARPDQAVRQQVRDPGRIIHVALATRHPLDVRRVRQHQLEAAVENVPDRLPVHAGRFHGHDRAPGCLEPRGKLQQSARRRREPAHLAMNPTLGDKPQAGHHFVLVHVETGTALMQCFHAHLPRGGRREALASGSLPNVLQDRRRPQLAGNRPWRQ